VRADAGTFGRLHALQLRHRLETTQAFYRYLQQPAARDILRRYGLALPGEQ